MADRTIVDGASLLPSSPIGIFDSGIGGLTVFREIMSALPHESLIYFGDTARVPYGPKGSDTVRRYSHEITDFLVHEGVKAVVVACNTATAHALESLQQTFKVPIIGVIRPGSVAAVEATRNRRIGVIGTSGLINSHAYRSELLRLDPSLSVFEQACPLFVPFIEEGWLDHAATRLVAREYLDPLKAEDVDTVVLGCTHYPLLKSIIQQSLGAEITLIDSAWQTARSVKAVLEAHRLINTQEANNTAPCRSRMRFITSDSPESFLRVGQSFLGSAIECVESRTLGS